MRVSASYLDKVIIKNWYSVKKILYEIFNDIEDFFIVVLVKENVPTECSSRGAIFMHRCFYGSI